MSPFLRQCLSREVVTRLLKPSNNYITLFKTDKTKKVELSELEVEKAIHPLFDYFDTNLMTLNSYLHPVVFTKGMTKVWKEIESIIEELLVPPLSDRPSEMKPLNGTEVDVVIKWLKVITIMVYVLVNYYNYYTIIFFINSLFMLLYSS